MRQVISALTAMTCLLFFAMGATQAQLQNGVSIGYHNRSEVNVIVRSYTTVNGVQRSGPALQMKKNGGKAFENGVPQGVRFITVHDANQPLRILLKDHPVPIQNGNVLLDIIAMPGNPNRLLIVPAPPPVPGQ